MTLRCGINLMLGHVLLSLSESFMAIELMSALVQAYNIMLLITLFSR